jgi:hypothetical protein
MRSEIDPGESTIRIDSQTKGGSSRNGPLYAHALRSVNSVNLNTINDLNQDRIQWVDKSCGSPTVVNRARHLPISTQRVVVDVGTMSMIEPAATQEDHDKDDRRRHIMWHLFMSSKEVAML